MIKSDYSQSIQNYGTPASYPASPSPLVNQLASIINLDVAMDRLAEASKCDSNLPLGKIKDIRIASVTDNYDIKGNINKDRQAVTDLTLKNHKRYADRWNLKHDIVSRSLVANECLNPKTGLTENCSAYWNKIKYFVEWCKQPAKSADKEEWAIYADDDAVYTNLKINPSEAIDKLRSNRDTSFIFNRRTNHALFGKRRRGRKKINQGSCQFRSDDCAQG